MENQKNYGKLAVTLVLAYILMYGIMFLNVEKADHIYLSMTRAYMTLLMICAMTVLMILRMPMMYANKKLNTTIIVTSVVIFAASFIGVHKQTGISDIQYMKGMIPHHSIAIMTSKHAHIKDARVRKLADGIIQTQVKEIDEMKQMIDSLEKADH
jgi:Domain of unknown function (DUF305)